MDGESVDRADRIVRLVAWAESKRPGGPDPEDVRVVAALGITRADVLGELLCVDHVGLTRHWDELQALLVDQGGLAAASPPDLTSPFVDDFIVAPIYPTVYPALVPGGPVAHPAAQPVPADVVQGTVGEASPAASAGRDDAAARHARLQSWRSAAAVDQPELAAISDEDLRRLAFSEAATARDVKQFGLRTATRSLFSALATQLATVLSGSSAHEVDAGIEGSVLEKAPEVSPVEPETPESPSLNGRAEPRAAGEWAEPLGYFAPFDWSAVTAAPGSPPGILSRPDPHGVKLTWQPLAGASKVLYRVVESTDTWAIVAPDTGVTIGATWSTEIVAPLAPRGATSYIAIWANEGPDEIAARGAQPRLVGKGEIVWPPRALSVSVTPAGEVVARFQAPPGADVEVQRFVAGEVVRYDQAKALRQGVSADGFLDRNAQAGVDLTYAVYTVAVLSDGEKVVSEPNKATVRVVPEPHSIALKVEPAASAPRTYDISWVAPPFGTVDVFLTGQQPPTGLGDQTRTVEVVEMQGLVPERRLNYPVQRAGDEHRMMGVTLDRSWVKGFFVAVHVVSSDAVRVGPTQSTVNARPPRNPWIVERVDTEIIMFEWPDDVRMIEVFQGPLSEQRLDPSQADVIATLTEDEYIERGGLRLKQPLPSNGCAIYLFGVVYDQGLPTRSAPVRVEYPGIIRLRYNVEPARRDGAVVGKNSPPEFYRVSLQTDEPMPPTPLCLVANAARLPLHPQDQEPQGLPVMTWPDVSPTPGAPVVLCELPVSDRRLFIRLFVNYPPALCGSVALLDPPVARLSVMA